MPFYQALSKMRSTNGLQLVALSREPVEITRTYTSEQGLQVDAVAMMKGQEIETSGTPILLLITQRGTIDASWIGQLSSSQQQEVVKHIKSALKLG